MKLIPFAILSTLVFGVMLLTASQFSAYALEFAHKTMWGEKGVAQGQFNQVSGIGVDSEDNVYVSDFAGYTTKMIQKFTPNGTFILGFGTFGNGPQYFTNPAGIAINSNDSVYIADYGNPTYAIKEFTSNGTFIRSIGSFGLGPGLFINPGGVGVDKENNLYATDFGENNNVQKFDQNGNFLDEFWVSRYQ